MSAPKDISTDARPDDSPSTLPTLHSTLHAPRIFLIGYRGSGKTSVARVLAERLDWDWLDADSVLETRHGRSIRQIFAEEGEAGFRDKEAALLEELSRSERHVIATGGGVVLRPANRACLQAGLVVWLTADAATLWHRITADQSTAERRPNLTVGGLSEVEDLLRQREPLYRACADLAIETDGRTPEAIVADILARAGSVPARPG
jgi:shikimate kinase